MSRYSYSPENCIYDRNVKVFISSATHRVIGRCSWNHNVSEVDSTFTLRWKEDSIVEIALLSPEDGNKIKFWNVAILTKARRRISANNSWTSRYSGCSFRVLGVSFHRASKYVVCCEQTRSSQHPYEFRPNVKGIPTPTRVGSIHLGELVIVFASNFRSSEYSFPCLGPLFCHSSTSLGTKCLCLDSMSVCNVLTSVRLLWTQRRLTHSPERITRSRSLMSHQAYLGSQSDIIKMAVFWLLWLLWFDCICIRRYCAKRRSACTFVHRFQFLKYWMIINCNFVPFHLLRFLC